jgi:hypothetical protein
VIATVIKDGLLARYRPIEGLDSDFTEPWGAFVGAPT